MNTTHKSKWHHADARVHYTVLTQHPNRTQTPPHKMMPINQSGTQQGDNAPDTQQCTNVQSTLIFVCTDTFTHVTKHHSNTRYCRLRCVSYPEFPNNRWQQNTRPLNHQPTIKQQRATHTQWVSGCNCSLQIKAP